MPRDSLNNLMDMFPYFFDKKETSNFYKSQSVTNNQFKGLFQSLFNVAESFKLNKRCLIWKVQSEPYVYKMEFRANFENIKTVTIYKNDSSIYVETYTYDEHANNFSYSYEHSTADDVEVGVDPDIIPQDTFKMIVETWDEYIIKKGFPENDVQEGNEFDHDESLDEIAALHNIPRKQYVNVDPELYGLTEPTYNDRLSEDDYHYMNRILNYMLKVHTLPLPVLEIWKLYGIEATMENREKLLLKMFDIYKHPHHFDENAPGDQLFVDEWTPQKWEHKDQFCDYNLEYGLYFFVTTSTTQPIQNQNVILSFKFLNSFAVELIGDYSVTIYVDDNLIVEDYVGSTYVLSGSLFNDEDTTIVEVTGKTPDGEIIRTEIIPIIIRGCNSADYYVSTSGNDSTGDGSYNNPYATIGKAVSRVHADKTLIAVLDGTYTITSAINVTNDCIILGCDEVTIANNTINEFFSIAATRKLILNNISLKYKWFESLSSNSFVNHNQNSNVIVTLLESGSGADIKAILEENNITQLINSLTYDASGNIKYSILNVEDIDEDSDLDGVIYGLDYTNNGDIVFNEISDFDLDQIGNVENAVTSLSYDNSGNIKYDIVGELTW